MAEKDVQLINGRAYSWSSISTKAGGERLIGIKSIEYSDNLEREGVYGQNRSFKPIGFTAGQYKVDRVKLSLRKDTHAAFLAQLAELTGRKSVGTASFPLVVQYTEVDLKSITDTLEGCSIAKNAGKAEQDPAALYVDIELDCLGIKWDGKTLYDTSEEGVGT